MENRSNKTKLSILSRNELKKLMAGEQAGDEFECDAGESCNCLICYTPGGVEEWCRTCSGNATTICRDIYPAYDENVTGTWGIC